jgi:hypothetical protein
MPLRVIRPRFAVWLIASAVLSSVLVSSQAKSLSPSSTRTLRTPRSDSQVLHIRAGGSSSKSSKKKKKKKKSKPDNSKTPLNKALKEKDAAEALGDAIRERADQLRSEPTTGTERSVSSLGWALGASDQIKAASTTTEEEEDDGGGVEAAPMAVLVHYFLKSHGGAHALQCVCSLLSTVAGLGSILMRGSQPAMSLTLMKRALLFAMVKHVSGLLAATFLTARAIPEVGLAQARVWMEELVTDPVSQYVFYTACVLLWLPRPSSSTPLSCWWQSSPLFSITLLGPVVLRELVSTALVLSDVLVLLTCSTQRTTAVHRLLRTGQSLTSAFMSLLVTPSVWRNSSAAERQAVLAKLTSRVSLALEVAVGVLLVVDTGLAVGAYTFSEQRPALGSIFKRLLCTRLFLQFLWTRRRKISRLATQVRGGALEFPMYVLQILKEPQASMGILEDEKNKKDQSGEESLSTWGDYVRVGLGLDEDTVVR